MGKLLIIITGLLLFASCSPKITTGSTKTIKEIVRDTTILVQSDSSFYQAWVECRDNTPVLVQRDTVINHDTIFIAQKGAYLKVPKVELKDNVLKVEATAEPHEVEAKIKEKTTVEIKTVVKKVEKDLNWWQQLFIWTGAISWLLLVAIVAIKLSPLSGVSGKIKSIIKSKQL